MPKGIYKHKPCSEETKRKIGLGNKGHKMSKKTKERLMEANKDKKLSEEHKKKISKALKGRTFSEEHRKNLSKTLKGRISWRKGKKLSEKTKRKISINHSHYWEGKLKSKEHRKKLSEAKKGEKCNFWKGGITPLTKLIRHSFEYRQWHSDIFTRDNFICQQCEIRGGRLHAHHIKSFSKILKEYNIKTLEEALVCKELWNINNGITYCKRCHKIIHKKLKIYTNYFNYNSP